MPGTILQLNVKPQTPGEHGLPKRPVREARLTRHGLEGDYNRYRQEKRGGDPGMALLLMPSETLAALRAEGWPLQPGDLGENVTTSGLPYDALPPGSRVRLGPEAVVEVSKACDPCKNLYALPYVGPGRGPEFLRVMMGRRGWYARVLVEGLLRQGDPIGIDA